MGKLVLFLLVCILAISLWSCGQVSSGQPGTTPAIPVTASAGTSSNTGPQDPGTIWEAFLKTGMPDTYHETVESPALGWTTDMDFVTENESGEGPYWHATVSGPAFYYEWLGSKGGSFKRYAADAAWEPYRSDYFPVVANRLTGETLDAMRSEKTYDIRLAGVETVEGSECYRLRITGGIPDGAWQRSMPISGTVLADVWIGKADHYLHKVSIEWDAETLPAMAKQFLMPFGIPYPMVSPEPLPPGTKLQEITTYSRLGEPIEIEPPQ